MIKYNLIMDIKSLNESWNLFNRVKAEHVAINKRIEELKESPLYIGNEKQKEVLEQMENEKETITQEAQYKLTQIRDKAYLHLALQTTIFTGEQFKDAEYYIMLLKNGLFETTDELEQGVHVKLYNPVFRREVERYAEKKGWSEYICLDNESEMRSFYKTYFEEIVPGALINPIDGYYQYFLRQGEEVDYLKQIITERGLEQSYIKGTLEIK